MDPNSILHQVEVNCFLIPAQVVQDPKVIGLCRAPYYQHSHGCPNWNHKDGCPPQIKLFLSQYYSLVQIAIARLDFEKYLQLKAQNHPSWTERALRNPRHWQGHLRAKLKEYLQDYNLLRDYEVVTNPEAMGVNIFETCANIGIVLEKEPKKYVYQVYLLAKQIV